MIEHRQQLLNSMGVELWAPRQLAVRVVEKNIWRDLSVDVEQVISNQEIILETVVEEREQVKVTIPSGALEKTRLIQAKTEQQTSTEPVEEENAPLVIADFRLHALVADQFILLTEQQQLPAPCQALWRNIQLGLGMTTAELQWPFPLLDLQDGNLAPEYVKGFLDAFGADKKIFSLGVLPIEVLGPVEVLASLQQMLEQPLSKQALWKKVSPLIK